MIKHKITPVQTICSLRYKLSVRKHLFGFIPYWETVTEWNDWTEDDGIKWFKSEEEALNYLKSEDEYNTTEYREEQPDDTLGGARFTL